MRNGYDVIFNYIVNAESLEIIQKEFKEYEIKFIVLLADENALLSRDRERPEECQMKERCITLLNSFKNKKFNQQNILDTTNLSINKIVNLIETKNEFIL